MVQDDYGSALVNFMDVLITQQFSRVRRGVMALSGDRVSG